jgi:hypothetical protein
MPKAQTSSSMLTLAKTPNSTRCLAYSTTTAQIAHRGEITRPARLRRLASHLA